MKRGGNRSRESVLRAAVKTTERRRMRRRRVGGLLLGLLGLPALAVGIGVGGQALWKGLFSENDFFRVEQIDVTTDGTLGREHILEYGRVREGVNLFALCPRQVRESLLTVPVVANAQVGRRLPDTLVIDILERVAVARLESVRQTSPLAVDAEGHVLGPGSIRPSLPTILGVRDAGLRPGDRVGDPMLQEALRVLDLGRRSSMRQDLLIATIDLSNEDYLELGLSDGDRILLSRQGAEDKLMQLPIMRRVARNRGLELTVYDMTVDRNFVGRPHGWQDAAQEGTE